MGTEKQKNIHTGESCVEGKKSASNTHSIRFRIERKRSKCIYLFST